MLPGLLAVAWVVLLGLASLAPALAHGSKLGTYDIAATYGLGTIPGTAPRNVIASDQVMQSAPWTSLDWTEVHEGHLPLWNPYSAMGTPLLFNFQSAGLSLPALVSYAAPLRFAYDVVIYLKLVIAGTGLLFASRVLRLSWLSAAVAAAVGELSGSFSAWLGWPMDGVMCWAGWLLGAGLLLAEGRRRNIALPLLAGSLAFAVYGGHPESIVVLGVAISIPTVVVLAGAARRQGIGTAARRLAVLTAGTAAGGALSAPVWLPALEALHGAVDQSRTGYSALPLRSAADLIFSGYYGYPLTGGRYFGAMGDYYETAAFVGLIGLVLAATALLCRWRRPAVFGIGLAVALLGVVVWSRQAAEVINHLPGAKLVVWTRALIPLDLLLALLVGVGFDVLLTGWRARSTNRRLALSSLAGVIVVAVLGYLQLVGPPGGVDGRIRAVSFRWPLAEAGVLLAGTAVILIASRSARRLRPLAGAAARVGLLTLASGEVAFMLFATPNLWSSSATAFSPTPAEAQLQALVGDERVGVDCPSATSVPGLGILPEANIAYGVSEAEMYDPVLPRSYLRTYARLSHTAPVAPSGGVFCVPVTSASLAREYGTSYVLQSPGTPLLAGAVAEGTVGGEKLSRVPGASVISLQPAGAPLDDPSASAVAFDEHDPSRLSLRVEAPVPSRLELHIGAFPGWSAEMDGRPMALRTLFGDQMQAVVPAGRHTVVLSYRPGRFVDGLHLAAVAVVGLVLAMLLLPRRRSVRAAAGGLRRRLKRGTGSSPIPGG